MSNQSKLKTISTQDIIRALHVIELDGAILGKLDCCSRYLLFHVLAFQTINKDIRQDYHRRKKLVVGTKDLVMEQPVGDVPDQQELSL